MHSPTLLLLTLILTGLMACVLGAFAFFNRSIRGMPYWAASYGCGFILCLALLLRSSTPGLASVLLTQALMFGLAYLNYAGAHTYMQRPGRLYGAGIAGLLLMLGLMAALTVLYPQPALRVGIASAVSGTLFLMGAHCVARGRLGMHPARYAYALASGMHGAFMVLRPWGFVTEGQGVWLVNQAVSIPGLIILESIVSLVLMAFGVLMLANEQTQTAIKHLADRDALTGVFNRRAFMVHFDKAAQLSRRRKTSLAILAVDLDHFKRINDTWGHKQGDDGLLHFVKVAQHCLRNTDLIGRIGGEEFAVILPDTPLDEAALVAERLRTGLMAAALPAGEQEVMTITASIGVTPCGRDEPPELALQRADQAMYQAKRNGRNQVYILPAPSLHEQGNPDAHSPDPPR
ncbi:GGDEF domain-containing protein [Zoogloea sp.]|uniref:GGDEF domain-containing protein n=1 Tax=Zoogloea sp. TaxID=49181 RepID=UPI00262E1294|nr:GGDEF domain-containing protein [Zoogloea sp.]MDD3353979.1 GGDEF domain-containing protein [Zoogloea sp.]